MKTVEVRELIEHISEILHDVEKKRETVEVTNRGEVVALLMPVLKSQIPFERPEGDIWADMDRLATEISARGQGSTHAVEVVHDVRRDL